ncbi:ComF family protein [Candidatus Roizmanbacteria bacterium]|nr:ComF family protein [Candidatus Roizmanbacteria bacterium]
MAIFNYDTFLKKIILQIKYRLATEVWREFAKVIRPEWVWKVRIYRSLAPTALLLPVPLHPSKERIRGFNQADLLGRFFSQYLPYPTVQSVLKIKKTPAQATLASPKKRRRNIQASFAVVNPSEIKGKEYIIIDDVVTTGATCREIAAILKKNGAAKVYALTLGHG